MKMEIKLYKVKQYNSTSKTVVCIDGQPVCIVQGKKTLSNILAYLQGYEVEIKDGKIKKILNKYRESEE
jgi:hypothetical protein